MAWIESHQELAQHPKTRRLKRALGVSLPTALGHLHLFWWWAMDYAAEGDLSAYSDTDIADAVYWEGDAAVFLDALRIAGFINDDRTIHDWQTYVGRLLAKRRTDAERKRRERGEPPLSNGQIAPSTGHPPDDQRTAPGVHATAQVNRNPNRNLEPLPGPETGDEATTAVVAMAIAAPSPNAQQLIDRWRAAHGKKKPPKLNPAQLQALEAAIPDLGIERLEEAVDWSAEHGADEFIKFIRGAYTKRQKDETDYAEAERARSPGQLPSRQTPPPKRNPLLAAVARRS